jgi:hypothetical protein
MFCPFISDGFEKILYAVTPAQAGVQRFLVFLDSGFRRNDTKGRFLTSYEFIISSSQKT